jgi:hypothetical protein
MACLPVTQLSSCWCANRTCECLQSPSANPCVTLWCVHTALTRTAAPGHFQQPANGPPPEPDHAAERAQDADHVRQQVHRNAHGRRVLPASTDDV